MKHLKSTLIVCMIALFGLGSAFATTCNPTYESLPFYEAYLASGSGWVSCYYADANNPNAGRSETYTSYHTTVSGPWNPDGGFLRCQAPGNPGICVFS